MSNLALEAEPVIVNQQTLLEQLPVATLITDKKGNLHYYNQEAGSTFSHEALTQKNLFALAIQFTQAELDNAIKYLNDHSQFISNLYGKEKETHYQLKMIKNPHDKHYLLTLYPMNLALSLENEPSARKEPSAYKEPSARKEPSAYKEPSAHKEPSAYKKPSAYKQANKTTIIKKNFKELKQFSRLSAMREISSSLADKLNQPLTAILSYTQAMQRLYKKNASSDEINQAMQRVVVNAENAGEIIRQIRSQLKVNTLNYTMTCINDLIQESIHLTELDNPVSQIKLITQYESEFTDLYIDKIQLRQVFFSLLNNAIDAVLCNTVNSAEIIVKTEKDLSAYTITISDNGPGFPDKIKHRLFEPFTTTKKNGIGIGLSMCHHILELHKGEISIQSKPHSATTITIRLPLNNNQAHT